MPRHTAARRASRALGALGLAAVAAMPRGAAAADPPTVHLVAYGDLDRASTLLTPDQTLPASKAFVVEVAYPGTNRVSARLHVWPVHEKSKCTEQPFGSRQNYDLAMSVGGTGTDRVLRATVPALQVNQSFCFAVTRSGAPSPDQAATLADTAVQALDQSIISKCVAGTPLGPDDTRAALKEALERGLAKVVQDYGYVDANGRAATPNASAAAEVAARLFAGDARAQCTKLALASAAGGGAARQMNAASAKLAAANASFSNLRDLPAIGAPLVVIAKQPRLASDLLDKTNAAALTAALAAAPPEPGFVAWHKAAKATVEAAAGKGDKTHAKEAPPKVPFLFVSGSDGASVYIPPAAVRAGYAGTPRIADLPTARMALSEILTAYPNSVDPAVVAWVNALKAKATAEDARVDFDVASAKAVTDQDAAHAALRKDLADLVASDDVVNQLVLERSNPSLNATAGKGTTTDNANYVAVDAGVLFAIPTRVHTDTTTWLVPYLGLNLYFTPVDRTIDPGDLVGPTFWQRVSLTVGLSLTAPSLDGKPLAPILLDRFPIVAFGYRVVQYARVSAGGMFYNLPSANPASNRTELSFAPSLGASLDLDVIDLFAKKL